MQIDKIINNNVVSVINSQQKELVIMGRGIAFGKKAGENVDKEKIEKIFSLNSKEVSDKFKTLLREVPIEIMEIVESVIIYAKTNLQKELNDIIYVSLTDHINFAIERNKKGMDMKNALVWDIKKLYKDEFLIGLEALKMIESNLSVILPEDEAAFIAMHIVNAELNEKENNVASITKVIGQVLSIVKYHFNVELDEESLNYFRFVTHLKFFAQRLLNHSSLEGNDDFLFDMVKKKHKDIFVCTEKIKTFLEKEYKHAITNDEMLYLTIHIERVVNR